MKRSLIKLIFLDHLRIKPITDTPNRLYVDWLAWIILYLFPYIANMAHNNVVIAEIWLFQNAIIYHISALCWILFQHFEPTTIKFKFCICKFNLISVTNHNPLKLVNTKSFKMKFFFTEVIMFQNFYFFINIWQKAIENMLFSILKW